MPPNERQKKAAQILKRIRREVAAKNSLPAYLVFTNEELVQLAKLPELNSESVKTVKGIAPKRMKDFVEYFYQKENDGEEGGQPDAADSRQGEPA